MAIQGTGTQADPYLVTNCEELRWAVSQTNSYVKLVNDIDFNDDSILWLWEPLFFTCAELDGNHKKITNCYCYQKSFLVVNDADASHTHIFKNTIIEAIYISGTTQNYSNNNASFIQPRLDGTGTTSASIIGVYFYDCDFRIKFYVEKDDAVLFYNCHSSNNGYCFLRRCILNIDTFVNSHQKTILFTVANPSSSSVIYGDVKNCEIKVNLHLANSLFTGKFVFNTDTSTTANQNYYVLNIFNLTTSNGTGINVENNAVFVNIDGINENLPDKLCIMLAPRAKIANCYFILNNVMGNYLNTKNIHFKIHDYPGCTSSCFMNDKAKFYNKNLKNEDPNMHVLTDAQCKNLQDLLDIGFVVV